MTTKTTADIRRAFLSFFEQRGHTIVESGSLVPAGDKTLLFTNAGMVPFKDVFLGVEQRPYNRATTAQRCVRAGGKHNDLDNVGYTARHHTFFEMLGNFSFGDYFKEQAIIYAWEFLTEVLKLPKEKLWITVYEDDAEAEAIWKNVIGIDPLKFSRCGEKDNFWSMGNTGPCGPCSEIFYDHGPEVEGGPPGSPEEDGDRYIEIWNLVFMQFNRQADGTLDPLPRPSVDTGMGLERVSAVIQNVHNNFDIDLFKDLTQAAHQCIPMADPDSPSLRVIADHIRSCAFLIVDGILPSNEGRGYVLRRIIRRAVRHGHKLGQSTPFFYKMMPALAATMGEAYPQLVIQQALLENTLKQEEIRFRESLDNGMRILEDEIKQLKGSVISGETVFRLYDTFGFPVDLVADVAREHNLTIDEAGFEDRMKVQQAQARQSNKFFDQSATTAVTAKNQFVGYETSTQQTKIQALYQDNEACDSLTEGQQGWIVLEQTPFYAESGGQVGDRGVISTATGQFNVTDTQKMGEASVCIGTVSKGSITKGEAVEAAIDTEARGHAECHHSATHLLHAALRDVLGTHVAQKGSLVEPDRLRFDFSHTMPVSVQEQRRVETQVNDYILSNLAVTTNTMPIDEAKKLGAMALFGEKYADIVRVVKMEDCSTELCGGTHVSSTGQIGFFKIVSESGISSGVRRLEALCGKPAQQWVNQHIGTLYDLAQSFNSSLEQIGQRVLSQADKLKLAENKIAELNQQLNALKSQDFSQQVQQIAGLPVLIERIDDQSNKDLRGMIDELKQKLQSAIIVLASVADAKVSIVCGVTDDLTKQVKAGDLVNHVAQQVGGKGGGRPNMAMAGGSQPEKIDAALQSIPQWLEAHISK